jgi:glutathione S-transferase
MQPLRSKRSGILEAFIGIRFMRAGTASPALDVFLAGGDRARMARMKLYDLEISGNCYKIRLFLSVLGQRYERIPINTKTRENKQAAFLGLNPRGQVPVLDDDGFIVWDSTSILVYLARKYGGEAWYPSAAREAAEVARWVAVSQQAEVSALARARAIRLFGTPGDAPGLQERGVDFLGFLDRHLRGRSWLALERPTIADIACYPYVALAPDGGIALDKYSALQLWLGRLRRLPGYVELPEPSAENVSVSSGPTGPGLSAP